jgi:hypothetical protein
MLRIGKGVSREAIKRALSRGGALTVTYDDILSEQEIREAVAGVREAGSPVEARPLLAWLASHPNAPADILRDLAQGASREILMSLALNQNLPRDLRKALLEHEDEDVRTHANHTFSRTRRH